MEFYIEKVFNLKVVPFKPEITRILRFANWYFLGVLMYCHLRLSCITLG